MESSFGTHSYYRLRSDNKVRDSQTLQMAGYEVDVAPDGEAGVKHYRNRPADLVVTNIRMQKKDGLEVINGGDAEVIDWEAYGRWMGSPVRRMR